MEEEQLWLADAIQNHSDTVEKWPGIETRSASDISSGIVSVFASFLQRYTWEGMTSKDFLEHIIRFPIQGKTAVDSSEIAKIDMSFVSKFAGKLSATDAASARYIVFLMNNALAADEYATRKWEWHLSRLDGHQLESLFSGHLFFLAMHVWMEKRPLISESKFGIDFMERAILDQGSQTTDRFWRFVVQWLRCDIVNRLLRAKISHLGSDTIDIDKQSSTGYLDVRRKMAVLLSRHGELCSDGPNPAMLRDIFYNLDDYSQAATIHFSEMLQSLKLTSWQLMGVCQAMPGWTPFNLDFKLVIDEYYRGLGECLCRAMGTSGSNVARLILEFV